MRWPWRRQGGSDGLQTLHRSRLLRSDAEVSDFEDALDRVRARMDPGDLEPLHLAFHDATEDPTVMWDLVHLIEDYPIEHGARAYLATLPEMLPTARDWMMTLVMRLLNDAAATESLIRATGRAVPAGVGALCDILDDVAAAGDPLAVRAAEVRAQIEAVQATDE